MRKPWGAALAPMLVAAALAQEPPPRPEPRVPIETLSPPAMPERAEPGDPAPGPEPEPEPEPDAPSPMPRPESLREGDRLDPGWTLRAVPDGSTLALAGGPGRVASLAAFCLGGAPWLALELEPPPRAESVRVGFGFSGERLEVRALREDGAGGAYVVELAEGPLVGLLAGADAEATLAIDGTQQGALSLAGSSAAMRAALEECHAL